MQDRGGNKTTSAAGTGREEAPHSIEQIATERGQGKGNETTFRTSRVKAKVVEPHRIDAEIAGQDGAVAKQGEYSVLGAKRVNHVSV